MSDFDKEPFLAEGNPCFTENPDAWWDRLHELCLELGVMLGERILDGLERLARERRKALSGWAYGGIDAQGNSWQREIR